MPCLQSTTMMKQGEEEEGRGRVEEDWLRFHYILYMSKMPGRLQPFSLHGLRWPSVCCTCTLFVLYLSFSSAVIQRKIISTHVSRFQVSKMDWSHRVTRSGSPKPLQQWEVEKYFYCSLLQPVFYDKLVLHSANLASGAHLTFLPINTNEFAWEGRCRVMQKDRNTNPEKSSHTVTPPL